MLKKLNKNQKGFTLVELIIVIAILGVLSALLIPRIMGNVDGATKSRNISNARTVASEITMHNAQMKVDNEPTKVIKAAAVNGVLAAADITGASGYTLPTGITIPIDNVDIIIDASGNASIKERP